MEEEQKDQQAETTDNEQSEEQFPKAEEQKPTKKIPIGGSRWHRFRNWYKTRKKWSIPASVLFLLIILALVPLTRYTLGDLFIKKDLAIYLVDSRSKSPIFNDLVTLDGKSCGVRGKYVSPIVCRNVGMGRHTVIAKMNYYQTADQKITIDVGRAKTKNIQVVMTATGRPFVVQVINKITGKPVAGLQVKTGNFATKTDSNGDAFLVADPNLTNVKVEVTGGGYNPTEQMEAVFLAGRHIEVTPVGKVYFLSKRTGKLNIMKSNLDGSGAKVVVSGTGNERDDDTVLLPSPDWKYIALLARRDNAHSPWLYVLSTAGDHLLNVDSSGNGAGYTLVGWAGSSLIYYETNSSNYNSLHPSPDKLKSYDAATGKTTLLDQSSTIHDADSAAYESYAFVMIAGNTVVYAKNWGFGYYTDTPPDLSGKKNTLANISANGQNHKIISNFAADDYVSYTQHSPTSIYIWDQNDSVDKYYDYTIGLAAPKVASIDSDQFYQASQTYYPSPDGSKTFWAENRDGKNTLLVGDSNGNNSTAVASLSKYDPYGWFTNDYLLVTKSSSELYIMSVKGGTAVKVTDYQSTGYGY